MPRSKLKLSFIANKRLRKTSFMRRKTGIMKKLNEITTLCDVQACAVIYSPYTPVPEVWPSNQGAQKVTSRFMEVPEIERNKNMVDHTTYLQEKIAKEKEKLEKLTQENHASQLRQSMFDCLKGKINTYQYKLPDLQNLCSYIQNYINLLRARAEYLTTNGESSSTIPPYLTANGESSSSLPPLPAVVESVNPSVVADTSLITAHVGSFDRIPYQNMNMNQNQNETVQHHVHAAGTGADPLVVYNYHQLPTVDLATTSHMPTITNTATNAFAPYINNNF